MPTITRLIRKAVMFSGQVDYLGQVHVMIMLGCSESGDFMACQDICVKHIDKVGEINGEINGRINGEIKSLGSARLCLRCELLRLHTKFRVSALRDEFRRRDDATAFSVTH